MTTSEEIYQAIARLPELERLRLVERVIHGLASAPTSPSSHGAPTQAGASVIGLWSNDVDLVDGMLETIMSDREHRTLRLDRV